MSIALDLRRGLLDGGAVVDPLRRVSDSATSIPVVLVPKTTVIWSCIRDTGDTGSVVHGGQHHGVVPGMSYLKHAIVAAIGLQDIPRVSWPEVL
ncbi:hypothetical protein [Mycobacterium leprae]|uniref:hypothetical protein n=1 Tax=Mycobacterium leprae TaxID=1769 RepID=UPI0003154767|nr:hypothetical protein [Mycobacterium leprae]